MEVLFYEYASCSTCKKAKKWLEQNKISFKVVPIVENPPSFGDLKKYVKASGLKINKFFNTSGLSYRALGLSEKLNTMSDVECLELLAADGKLIKRPLLVTDHKVLVGFRELEYSEAFCN